MCGIAGIVSFGGRAPDRNELVRMCDLMIHRGPDDDGYLVDGPVGLGMRRLSIIDLAGGHQPVFNEDESVAVVLNGEIYNYRELRTWLISQGHRFRTQSDTEVLVHLWEEVGIDFPSHLNGMFAAALYDRRRRQVVLVRDHVGVKPLYYAAGPKGVVFASEVKAVLGSGRVERRLDVDCLAQFLAWEYTPGARTLLKDVRRLEPARSLLIDLETRRLTEQRYWVVPHAENGTTRRTAAEWEQEADELIRRCVRRQLVSDVPLGANLSGGVDSTLVVAAMDAPQTYSVGFEDASYDETRWAAEVAGILGVRHHVEIIRPHMLDMFDRLMNFMDDPIADSSIFPSYLVAERARRDVKVVLTGEGGDELFGGYETFVAQEWSASWQRLPVWLRKGALEPLSMSLPPASSKKGWLNMNRRFVEGARLDPAWGHARWRMFCDDVMRERLFTAAAREAIYTPAGEHILRLQSEVGGWDVRDQALYVDFASYLVDNCLAKVDRMSMACSLEARVPLLDPELVAFAFSVPSALKFDSRRSKILLKRVAARYVPRRIAERRKEGFSAPIKHWLRGELRGLVEHYLSPGRLRQQGLFEAETVQRLWQDHLEGRANNSHLLWALLVFEQWCDRWSVTR